MTYTCTLATKLSYHDVEKLLRTELKRTHKRSKVTITNKQGFANFKISAADLSALRAAFNGITSILNIYEKTHELTQQTPGN